MVYDIRKFGVPLGLILTWAEPLYTFSELIINLEVNRGCHLDGVKESQESNILSVHVHWPDYEYLPLTLPLRSHQSNILQEEAIRVSAIEVWTGLCSVYTLV